MGIRNLSKTSLREIEFRLADYGRSLGEPLVEEMDTLDAKLDALIVSIRNRVNLLEREVQRCVDLKQRLNCRG